MAMETRQKKAGVLPCSGEAEAEGTIARNAVRLVMERYRSGEVDLHVYDLSEDSAYAEYMKKLKGYLRQAGEDELADRAAFSLRQITPAVAVEGRLEAFGMVPEIAGFLGELGLKG